ncbi:hypothetical protein [Roseococcus sp. YIM B11640]|uniref:hypothetical protein n=1 Tax=Roseococcus sp. YIM B11640 TaxID=3133973 RepID=UPI003C7D2374
MPKDDEDATVRLPPPPGAQAPRLVMASPPRHGTGPWIAAGAGALLLMAGGGTWWWLSRSAPPAPAPPPAEAPAPVTVAPVPPAAIAPPRLPTAEILAFRGVEPTAFRWASNPLVWILDFPNLDLQGQALNRAAALLEKARGARDRVLTDEELAAAIAADRRSPSTWYFGHNYRASDLMRVFELADRAGIRLNPQELWLREQVELSRRVDRSRDAAFLTLPALGPHVDESLRRSILMHELGHGQFFTMPFFAAHVMRVWETTFTQQERAAIRRFLAHDGYDQGNEELMANEAMAYLLYTPDRRFFDPARDLGWSDAQANRLREALRAGAPEEP